MLSILVILLLLTFNFQSLRLALTVLLTVPAVLCGVLIMLFVTGTTLNVQSFMGAIMAIGVAVANAILFVTFSEFGRCGCCSGRRPKSSPGDSHDGGSDDLRNDSDGPGLVGERKANGSLGQSGYRRPGCGHCLHFVYPALDLRHPTGAVSSEITVAESL